jgi:hypothetical protein
MKRVFTLAAFAIVVPAIAAAERAKSPADATVFVRLVGSVHAEFEEAGVSSELLLTNGLAKARVVMKVTRILVCFPPEAVQTSGVALGPFQDVESKGVGLRFPEALSDVSPFRSRVETDSSSVDVVLRIDRVLSPWSARQVEQSLVHTQLFESLSASANESQVSSEPGRAPLLLGRSTAYDSGANQEVRMEYAVLDLGPEKLVARFVGPTAAMAFNASVVRASLASLEGRRLLGTNLDPVEQLEWPTGDALLAAWARQTR